MRACRGIRGDAVRRLCCCIASPFFHLALCVSSGAGDRLGLTDEITGECLPAAMLPYCGRSMIEMMMRDLQVRGPTRWRRQVTIPGDVLLSAALVNWQCAGVYLPIARE